MASMEATEMSFGAQCLWPGGASKLFHERSLREITKMFAADVCLFYSKVPGEVTTKRNTAGNCLKSLKVSVLYYCPSMYLLTGAILNTN